MPVYRNDTGVLLDLAPSELRYGPPTATGRIALGLTSDSDGSRDGDVPYFRPDPSSPVCLRATVVPSLAEGFHYFLTVPCHLDMQGEVAP